VTSFITNEKKILLLKRSDKVKSMRGLWAGVSGIIEKDEEPLSRAKIEIYEEIGISEDRIKLIKTAREMNVSSPQYENHEWIIFPFLFEAKDPKIKLNWENSEYVWINAEELSDYKTVPSLDKVLLRLL
jgi:8-oxo-dGTP pyrophosphatase MutT (NUDIX family)